MAGEARQPSFSSTRPCRPRDHTRPGAARQVAAEAPWVLTPQDLGQVHISLKLDDNLAQLQMVSPHSHVRAALEAALPMLRTQLAESGIQLGQSNISSGHLALLQGVFYHE